MPSDTIDEKTVGHRTRAVWDGNIRQGYQCKISSAHPQLKHETGEIWNSMIGRYAHIQWAVMLVFICAECHFLINMYLNN